MFKLSWSDKVRQRSMCGSRDISGEYNLLANIESCFATH